MTTDDMLKLQYLVITKITDVNHNLASAFELYTEDSDNELLKMTHHRVSFLTSLMYKTPVFHVGEVIIANQDGREIPYPARKPAKWGVEFETFDAPEAAVAHAEEVLRAELDERRVDAEQSTSDQE